MLRRALQGGLLIATSLLAACDGCNGLDPFGEDAEDAARAKARKRIGRNLGGDPQVVVFIVLDTVRADHTSLCGYDRDTTPRMASMAKNGAAISCNVYAPAPWTLPSHASFFTGTSVTDHGTMFVANSDVEINQTITARPLADSYETLAEIYKARGYQTVALSANSILNEASGLLQGFDHTDISTNGQTFRMRGLGNALRLRLDALDPEQPLFLFINIYDAHDPYPAVGQDVDWAEPQGKVVIDAYTHDPANPYYAFIKGLMPEEERPAYLQTLTDGYDYGVLMADTNLAVAMTALLRGGWFEDGYRMVVTSDHGEFLGEHGLLRHCGFVWEPVVKVPLLYFDTTRRRQPKFPEVLSGIDIFHLVKDGKLPSPLTRPHTVSEKNPEDIIIGQIAGALWDGTDKAVCAEGERSLYDLATDPGEESPSPVGDHPLAPELDATCAAIQALHTRPPPQVDPAMTEALKAMGYVQ